MISGLKIALRNNLKNIRGWKTPQKIVAFAVDDYGNVRLDSPKARAALDKAGVNKSDCRFDRYDTLETRQDLEALYTVLERVTDQYGRHAVMTPLAVPCNIDFESMQKQDFGRYISEDLPQTYEKLAALQPTAYEGAWALWREGIEQGLLRPQFHGREHFNLKVFEEKLASRDHEVLTALRNRSYTSISDSGYPTISITAAFGFWDFQETEAFGDIITDGLNRFEKVFGYRARYFTPPCGQEHPVMHPALHDAGIKYLDVSFMKREHLGHGKTRRVINYTGKRNALGHTFVVRNVVFEPTNDLTFDCVGHALRQVETAFRWKRPAVISSHRVNFCGHIDEKNRKHGLGALQDLLTEIVKRWPDVVFMSADELGDSISCEQ